MEDAQTEAIVDRAFLLWQSAVRSSLLDGVLATWIRICRAECNFDEGGEALVWKERYWRYHLLVICRLPTGDGSLLLPVGGVLREGNLGMWIINVE